MKVKRNNLFSRTDRDIKLLELAECHNLAEPPVPSGKIDEKMLTIAEKVALQQKAAIHAKMKSK